MTPVRCALVGVGMMGSLHAAILGASPAAELTVACDPDHAARDRLPAGTRLVADLEAALDEPGLEAVIVASPPAHHREAVEGALGRGLAVLCEKPVADTLADADEIVQRGSRPGARVVIGHMFRFDPRYRAIQRAVAAGELGRPVQLTARGNVPDFEGRLLARRTTLAVENLVHTLDLMRWLAGPIVRVSAEASATDILGPGVVDAVVATARFASGAVGTLATAWIMPTRTGYESEHFFSFLGSDGLAWIDGRDSGTGIVGSGGTRFPSTLTFEDPAGVPYGLYRAEVEAFLAGVRHGGAWPVSLQDARDALSVALAIDRSIASGRPEVPE